MIIVSQDKKKIINFDNVLSIHIQTDERKSLLFAETERYAIFLAEYKTEERAREVLRELINRIVLTERFEAICIPERQDNMVIDMYDNDRPLFVYEMPEE